MVTSAGVRTAMRVVLGAGLMFAGASHLTFARESFRAQVPDWVPFSDDEVVLMSGVAELGLGGALLVLPGERRRIGAFAAAFFTAIVPGNLSQWRHRRDAFGLDTDRKRAIRLLAQPLLVTVALWSTR